MAKSDDISFIEQHLEKGVLLVCLILLTYALGQWVLHSPRKVDGVGPGRIDDDLLKRANTLKRDMGGAKAKVTEVPDYGDVIALFQDGPSFESMIDPVAGPIVDDAIYTVPRKPPVVLLADVKSRIPAPEKPLAWAGYRIPQKDPKKLADVPGAHVGLYYPWRQLKKNWMQDFQETRIMPRLVALAVRVRVQEAVGNGEFGPESDLVTVAYQKTATGGQLVQVPELIPYTGKNLEEVEEVITQITNPLVQSVILRPDYWPIFQAATKRAIDWRNNLPKDLWPAAKEPLAKQLKEEDHVLIWFHHDGLAGRTSYRYKAQLLIMNPLLTHDKLAHPDKPQDARVATLATPWSPWSEPVRVPKTTSFLLTGSSPQSRTRFVTATVFARALGKQVQKRFNVSAGQSIGSPHEEADFSTGAIVVNLSDRYVYSGLVRKTTTEMLYLDDNGVLCSRTYYNDRKTFDAINRVPKSPTGVPRAGTIHEELFESTIGLRRPAPTVRPRPTGRPTVRPTVRPKPKPGDKPKTGRQFTP